MICLACGAETTVCDSRRPEDGSVVRRRRRCLSCARRITTIEVPMTDLDGEGAESAHQQGKLAAKLLARFMALEQEDRRVVGRVMEGLATLPARTEEVQSEETE